MCVGSCSSVNVVFYLYSIHICSILVSHASSHMCAFKEHTLQLLMWSFYSGFCCPCDPIIQLYLRTKLLAYVLEAVLVLELGLSFRRWDIVLTIK